MRKTFYYTALIQFFISYSVSPGVWATPGPSILKLDLQTPKTYLIEDIQVTGAETLDKEAVIALAGIKVSDAVELPGPLISEAIHRLWKKAFIKDVNIYASPGKESGVVLTIHITESLRLSHYSFEGINNKEQKKLLEHLSLAKEKIVTDELIEKTKQAIKDYWIEKGYRSTSVAITSLPDPQHAAYVQLHIKINTGKKLTINTIEFEGNHHISSDDLKGQLKNLREKPRFSLVKNILKQVITLQPIRKGGVFWRQPSLEELGNYYQKHVIFSRSTFSHAKLQEDKKRLMAYYQSKGFRDVAILEEVVYKHEEGYLNIKIKIEEGPQYYVGHIRWVGNHLYDDDTLSRILGIKEGDTYNPTLLQQKLFPNPYEQNIASLYKDHGYLFSWAEAVEVGLEENKVSLEIRIQEGPETRINKVLIAGNKHTREEVIRRELRTLPGDKFSMTNVFRSQRELVMLNIFDPAAIGIDPLPNNDGTVDIKYTVKEKFDLEGKLAGSYSDRSLVGTLMVGTKNFSLGNLFKGKLPRGQGQTLQLQTEIKGRKYKSFGCHFSEPWLGGTKPRQFHLSLNSSFEENRGSIGGSIGLGTKLSWPDDYTELQSSIAYYRHYYKNYNLLDTGKEGDKKDGNLNDLSVKIFLKRNSTDHPIYPRTGSRLELSANLTPPYSWFSSTFSKSREYSWKEYHQWIVDGSYFLNLSHGLVLNARGQFGVLGNFSSRKSIGPYERFYLGGSSGPRSQALRGQENISLRGYQDEYFPLESDDTSYKGGVIYDKFMLELRYLIIASPLTSIYTLLFAEAGNTWPHYEDCHLLDLKKSVGLGLRLHLPFLGGTLGFDWGYGFDKKPDDESKGKLEFNFSFGAGKGR